MEALLSMSKAGLWLEQQLCKHGKDCVVITYTAPSLESIAPRYQADMPSAAFASNLGVRS